MPKDGNVRVLIGTRKGGYIAESNAARKKWTIKGPFQDGREVFHVAADPRNPGDLYAAANSGWWGPVLVRSSNWGKSWTEIAPPGMALSKQREQPGDNGPPKRPITNLWHIEPGHADDPKTIFLGIDPASLYRSDDRGDSWEPVTALNEHETRSKWNPGAGGMCLHTILIDPSNPKRMYVGISAAGTFRTDDAGASWRPANKGVLISFLPEPVQEFGQCVHKVAMDPADPSTLYRQDHDGVYVSHDGMDSWKRVGKPLESDFGFNVTSPASQPGTAYFVPLKGEARTTFDGGMQVYRYTDKTKQWKALMTPKKFPGEFGMHREGMASDALDPAGIYVGTTTGQLFYSRDGGKGWEMMPHAFPGIHSVSVANPSK